jgi:aminoglycoside N3'-acetyltransferase
MPAQRSTKARFIMGMPTSIHLAEVGIAGLVVLGGHVRANGSRIGASLRHRDRYVETDAADFVAIDKYVKKEMEATPEARFRKEEQR